MSEIITFPLPTGVNYVIPDVGDENWGQNVTDFLVAIPSGVMPTSGTFSLTGDVSFGPTFGLVSQYFKTATTIPATAGVLRLSKTDSLDWRNNANSANLALAINGSDQLTFAGTPITVGGVTSITGTTNQVIASASTGAVTLSTPQSIAPASSPTFAGLTLSAPLTVPNGGTGDSSFTAYSVLCGGTSSVNPLQSVASVGLSGQFLQSQGPGMLPTWANAAGTGTVNSGTAGHAAYYATSTNTVSDGGSANIQVGSLKTTSASLQLEIKPGAHSIILDASSPVADRIYTLPDRGANDTFAFLGGQPQTFVGLTTFNSAKLGAAMDANSQQINNLGNATAAQDATAYSQVQYVFQAAILNTNSSSASVTGVTYASTNLTATITPTSASSRIKITAQLCRTTNNTGGVTTYSIFRDSTDLCFSSDGFAHTAGTNAPTAVPFCFIDSPASTSPITYSIKFKNTAGTTTSNASGGEDVMILEELR